MKITTLLEAEKAWKNLQDKYLALSNSIYNDKPLNREKKEPSDLEINRADYTASAKKIQRSFRKFHTEQEQLIKVNPKGSHSSLFQYFMNSKQEVEIFKSINIKVQHQLLTALEKSNWSDSIFKNPLVMYVSLALYDAGKISMQQFFTILERNQLRAINHLFPIRDTYQILDANEQFTPEAIKYLLPQFQYDSPHEYTSRDFKSRRLSTKEDIESFRLLILQSPKSEQIFNLINATHFKSFTQLWVSDENRGELAYELIRRQTISFIDEPHSSNSNEDGAFDNNQDEYLIVHLSFGVRDALGIAEYGEKYTPIFPRLNEQKISDIEKGVRHDIRPASIFYPGTTPYKNIHNYKIVSYFEATEHDYYHAQGLSALEPEVRKALLMAVDIIRSRTNFHWSKETWKLIDADFLYLKSKGKDEQLYTIFKETFISPQGIDIAGTLLLIDCIENKQWKNLNLYLPDKTSLFSDKDLSSSIERILGSEKNKMVQLVKCHLLLNLKNKLSPEEINIIIESNLLNNHLFLFNKAKDLKNKNALILEIDGKPLNLEGIKNDMLSDHKLSIQKRNARI